jgi:hypothetical protein
MGTGARLYFHIHLVKYLMGTGARLYFHILSHLLFTDHFIIQYLYFFFAADSIVK